MNHADVSEEKQTKSRLAVRFRNINMGLLLLFLALLLSIVAIMFINITRTVSKDYARLYSAETAGKFEKYISKDLVIVNKVSHSRAVSAWLSDEGNQQKKADAYGEVMSYADLFPNALLYLGIGESLNEYALDIDTQLAEFEQYDMLDPAILDNRWYYDCLSAEEDFTLNVDIDKVTQKQRLWINNKVFEDNEVVGVFCSGLLFSEVIEEIFGQYDNKNVRGYVINKNGFIQIDSDPSANDELFNEGSSRHISDVSSNPAFMTAIDSHLGTIDGLFDSSATPQVVRLSEGNYRYLSIAPIVGTNWMTVTFFDAKSLFSVMPLFSIIIVMLVGFIIYAIAGSNLIRSLVLVPLRQLTNSVSEIEAAESQIYGVGRADEFGKLAQTIQDMRNRLNMYNSEIMLTAKERDQQSRRLYAVNNAAAILLTADEDKSEASLREGTALMAGCVDVDCIYICRNEMKDGISCYSRQFEWGEGSGQAAFYDGSISEWEEKFLQGECVNGPLHSMSQSAQDWLKPSGVISILIIPVYLRDCFWGFVRFDDCHQERTFTEGELDILRSGSLMLASTMDRMEATVKVHEADERTKLMLDAMPLCCNLWDQDFNIIDCNEEAIKLFGLKDKHEYMDGFFALSPEYQPNGGLSVELALEYIRTAFRDGRVDFEWMHQKPDGTPMPAEITLVRVKHGEDYIIAGYTRDMREYKKMMRDIEHKDILMHTVNEAASILLRSEIDEFEGDLWQCMGMLAASSHADRVYIWRNHVVAGELYCTQLYEWSEGAEPQQGSDITIDIPYDENIPGWEEKLSSGKCVNGIVRNLSQGEQDQLSPQGILSILVVPVFLQDHFWGFVGFDDCNNEREFTSDEESVLHSGSLLIANALLRNEMAQSIQNAAAKMEAVITNYAGIIWSVDKDGTVTLFNGLYLKELGITPDLVEGKSLETVRQRIRHLDIIENIKRTIEEGAQDWIYEVEDKSFRAHTAPIHDDTGSITGVVGSVEDITDTIRLQNELEKAVDEAQSASRAKGNFLSNMSHEMRTPMNAIIGMTMIGKSAAEIEKKDYAFGKIEAASNHLLGVINDILDMSKIEANKFELSNVEFNFEKLLQNVVNVIVFRIDEKQQDFIVHLDRNIPQTLVGDNQRLTQVITNLLSNAVKFTPEHGSIRLNTYFLKEEDGVCSIKIEVTDTGIGINEEQQVRLFHSFEQAENNTARKFGGTGLGLAISKNIVELMGGSIWVESEMGKGAKFVFTIQVKRGEEREDNILDPSVNWKNIKVLIVDDAPETCEYFASITAQFGIACDTASSGEEALKMIEDKGSYDLYFIDWKMPGMNGIELSERIKTGIAAKSIIIMISATEWNTIEADAKGAGVDKFLPKPLFPSSIADCINQCIGVRAPTVTIEAQPEEKDNLEDYCILLAEDVEINREIVMAMLKKTQVQIDCAVNGKEALQMVKDHPDRYNLIFMDIQMPEMDGLEATQQIRALDFPQAQEIPIIAMTANVFQEDIERCLAVGMNAHVGKPLNPNEILTKLKHFLRIRN